MKGENIGGDNDFPLLLSIELQDQPKSIRDFQENHSISIDARQTRK